MDYCRNYTFVGVCMINIQDIFGHDFQTESWVVSIIGAYPEVYTYKGMTQVG